MSRHFKQPLSIVFTSLTLLSAGIANADEAPFLKSLSGDWSGTGTVKVRVNAPAIGVKCRFTSDTTAASLSLDGKCTSFAIFSRAISADLEASGDRYSGSYIGAGTGTAGLGGQRAGDTINLGITWAKEVNGDRKAQMTIEKVSPNRMRLTTVDTDPKTGKPVITSRIDLQRS
ncbi:hypothetical protein [Neorhizobium alkalisoli]|jgi:hypothetical protein|uniref:Uncharacterized protein n=1 Tax=Neorhizobium alkalisoli TaxID=528178 RepID=A0A561QBA2_9HYPH|nr:hypothetical protein [Neorhizobium alkalisoli]TWF47656.1 hypothetical protein FHW37_111159 [Neorhizobium alkalisoli]